MTTLASIARRCAGRILVALVLLLPLLACGAPAPTPEPVTVTFAFPEWDGEYYQPLAEAYNRSHPNVTVKLLPREWEGLNDIGPQDADVFVAPFSLRRRIEEGQLLSIDVWLTTDESFDKDDFFPGALDLFAREGKTWAVPAGIDVIVMYYNKDLLDQRQVPYPKVGWTWEDFLNTAIGVRAENSSVYGYAATGSEDAVFFVYQHGGRLVDDLQNPTQPTLDDPLTIEAVQWYADLIFEHGVAPTPQEARRAFGGSEYAVYAGIASGRVGLWTGAYSSRGGITWPRKWEFRWGVTTLPRDRQAATLANVEALAISAETKNPEACWQWVSFLSRQVPSRLAPARRSVAESAAFERQVGADVAATARAAIEQAVLISPDTMEAVGKLAQAWDKAMKKILDGEALPREALVEAQREAMQ